MKIAGLLLLAANMLYATVTSAQTNYTYQFIDYPGAEFTQIFGINDRGQVAGTGIVGGEGFPFLYDIKKGTFTNIATVEGYGFTSIEDVSDSGVMVGSVDTEDNVTRSAVIIDKQGNATVFDHPDAFTQTVARAVNNNGLVTGYRNTQASPAFPDAGFIYDSKTGGFTDIVPSLFTIAHGINSRGEVTGSAYFFGGMGPCPLDPGVLWRYGWLRDKQGNVTYFTVNGSWTSGRGLSDTGTISGIVNTDDGAKTFVAELDGTQCQDITIDSADLISVPGASITTPGGINNSGAISGSWSAESNLSGFVAIPAK